MARLAASPLPRKITPERAKWCSHIMTHAGAQNTVSPVSHQSPNYTLIVSLHSRLMLTTLSYFVRCVCVCVMCMFGFVLRDGCKTVIAVLGFYSLSTSLFVRLCQFVCLSACLPVCLSVFLSICLSVCLSACL